MDMNDTTRRSESAACSGAAALTYPVLGSLKTRASAEIRSSPLSVGYETLDRHMFDLVNYRGKINPKGLLRGTDYTPKPAYAAYQNLCALFDAETDLHPAEFHIDAPGAVTACFKRQGHPVFAYWSPEDPTQDHALQTVTAVVGEAERAALSEPVLLDPLSGIIYAIASFTTLPLADYPLIITDARTFPIEPFPAAGV